MDTVAIPIKAKPQDPECLDEKMADLCIVAPHELTGWLLQNHLVRFDSAKALEFWRHHRRMQAPWMSGPEIQHPELSRHYQPVSLYADEAEYTASKEKITILFLSHLHELHK